jgi:hypothetical protein
LLAEVIIYWNTNHLGGAVVARKRTVLNCALGRVEIQRELMMAAAM